MKVANQIAIIVVLAMASMLGAFAQSHVVFAHDGSCSAIPLQSIDSIKIKEPSVLDVFLKDRTIALRVDSALWNRTISDTLVIDFRDDRPFVQNPHLDYIQVDVNNNDVTVVSTGKQPIICKAMGSSSDGRIIIDSDTTLTLVLSNLRLVSTKGSAIYLPQKHDARIVLADETVSTLSDAATYQVDSTDTSNACLYSKGSLTFAGNGMLNVTGNHRHAITSSKNICVEGGSLIVNDVMADGLHCDKLTMKDGMLQLHIASDASKGIKCKKAFIMEGGSIEAEGMGNLTIEDGEASYCSLLKSNGDVILKHGHIAMKQYGTGGRCISVDGNMLMQGGILKLENYGAGGSYLSSSGDSAYFTPKCITVNGRAHIERGQLSLLATGNGGKGLDSSDTLCIGRKDDVFLPEDSLCLIVETRGKALIDNVDEDYRRGCPKAIKCDNELYIYSGNLRINTFGQGGEGIESKGSLRAYNATIIADCYDDGINTGMRCYIDGAHIYCRSVNNDGIDSNGKVSIMDGIVVAISEHETDECFDTNGGRLNIYGGYVAGIGNEDVLVSQQTCVPYYATPSYLMRDGYQNGDSIIIHQNSYLTISQGPMAVISLYHDSASRDAFILVATDKLKKGQTYDISDGAKVEGAEAEWLDGRVTIGGLIIEKETLFNFIP